VTLTPQVRRVLEDGVLCHVAARTRSGPHVTPMVYAVAGDRLWVTTSRGSTKARAWRTDDRVAGLVRGRDDAFAFAGRVATHDVLDPATWFRSAVEAPLVTLASARFATRNARFFAGYAVDANHVPLAWTPPGRVFAELRFERWALLRAGLVEDTMGEWPFGEVATTSRRRGASGSHPFADAPGDVAAAIGRAGDGALALDGSAGPVVLPARWALDGRGVTASLGAAVLALAGSRSGAPAALEIDRASTWRARDMIGAMIRGRAEVRSATARAGVEVAVVPERVVWWRGWESGTVSVP
jgi:hypothetical protein